MAVRPAGAVRQVPETRELARDQGRSYRVEALAKGLRLLSLFTPDHPALRVKDLVTLSGIPMPTDSRRRA